MTRYTATASASARLWCEVEAAARTFGRMFAANAFGETSLGQMEGENARVRQSSRHWLMG